MVPRLPHGRALSAETSLREVEVGQREPGRHNQGPSQGWLGAAREACGEGRVCVCVCVHMYVCDDRGALGLDNIYMLRHECECQFIQNHTLKKTMTSVYTEFPITKLSHNAQATA